uniref:Uncharacterized protein n=1 Tax=Oryza brachyantha TaxID=4533 RepID=J3MEB2_ORYBR
MHFTTPYKSEKTCSLQYLQEEATQYKEAKEIYKVMSALSLQKSDSSSINLYSTNKLYYMFYSPPWQLGLP